ncbi:hypothetical protein M758_4G020000 [Ceratodon purpureus]|nr:hypothetical protein M758_4G020000 [Ceratodon purpureus]
MVAPVVGRPLSQVLVSEAKRNWPFVVGFAVTFTLVAKLSASLDPKEAHKSKFVDPYGHHWLCLFSWFFKGFILSCCGWRGRAELFGDVRVNHVLLAVTLALQSEPGLSG